MSISPISGFSAVDMQTISKDMAMTRALNTIKKESEQGRFSKEFLRLSLDVVDGLKQLGYEVSKTSNNTYIVSWKET